jgi:hypothetical protein
MSSFNDIRAALETHLADMPLSNPWDFDPSWDDSSPTVPSVDDVLQIAWPNAIFEPRPNLPHLRVQFLPTSRRAAVVGPNPEQRLIGLFFVTVYTPEMEGSGIGMTLADLIMARFDASSSLITPKVTVRLEYSEVRLPLHDPPFFAIPVEIGWYAYKT